MISPRIVTLIIDEAEQFSKNVAPTGSPACRGLRDDEDEPLSLDGPITAFDVEATGEGSTGGGEGSGISLVTSVGPDSERVLPLPTMETSFLDDENFEGPAEPCPEVDSCSSSNLLLGTLGANPVNVSDSNRKDNSTDQGMTDIIEKSTYNEEEEGNEKRWDKWLVATKGMQRLS